MHINHESPAFTTNGCKWVQDQPELYPQVPKVGWTGLDRAFYRLFSEKSTPKTRFLLQFQCNMHVYRPANFFTYSRTWLTLFRTQIIKIGDPRCNARYVPCDTELLFFSMGSLFLSLSNSSKMTTSSFKLCLETFLFIRREKLLDMVYVGWIPRSKVLFA